MLNIGLIGIGYWGANYVRIFNELKDADLSFCCDISDERLKFIKDNYPGIKRTDDYRELLKDDSLSGLIIATQATTHFKIVKEALESGKNVFVEKPVTLRYDEAVELAELADAKGSCFMVGHVFEFNPAVIKMKEIIEKGDLGRIYYLHFTRTGLGPIRDDVNAMWDLAPHDVSILNYLIAEEPVSVDAVGRCFIREDIEDVVFLTVEYGSGIIAKIHTSWIDPRKKREVTVVGNKKMIVFDDMSSERKLELYDKGVVRTPVEGTLGEFQLSLRDGDVSLPEIEDKEPLKEECLHFIDCIKQGARPKSDGWSGAKVVKILEDAGKILKQKQGKR